MTVNANADEYLPLVGLDSLYIAEVTQDDASAYVADTPEVLADAAECGIEISESNETHYFDDKPHLVIHSEGNTVLTLKVAGVPIEMIAKITGKVFDSTSGRMYDTDDVPPYCALSFRSLKSNGKYHYVQYMKGMFSIPKTPRVTKGEKATPQLAELTFTAIHTTYAFDTGSVNETVKAVEGDEDTTNFSGATWFSQVQTPSVSTPSALALSSSNPLDAATGVAVSVSPTLTFNNALVNDAVNMVSLIKASDHSVIASAFSLDTAKKILTINPDSNLSASTEYYIVYNVEDIYGDWLSGTINFTTA